MPVPRLTLKGGTSGVPVALAAAPGLWNDGDGYGMTASLDLTPGRLALGDLRRLRDGPVRVALDASCAARIDAAAATVADVVAAGRTVYGINTGFGLLARTRIDAASIEELQRNLVLSHAAGVGPPLPDRIVRLVLLLKINALAQGYSGVRRPVVDALAALLAADVLPVVPAQGSVGASGDLAPLAHLSLPLIGEGAVRVGGETLPATSGLRRAGLAPLALAAKEGLALLNGTQVSTALALEGLFAAEDCLAAGLVAGALSVDAMLGSDVPFRPEISALRGQAGQRAVAAVLWDLLQGSAIRASHLACDRVQDPYSLRCQPQVMGACLDLLEHAAAVLLREANGVSDNPLVFAASGEILSGGNFHAQPVAFAADILALALAEIGSISERRVAQLTDPAMSQLPAFLVAEPGLHSGFMVPQVTAAALVAENRMLAHPASVDSLPTSANQEDHVSMATHGARRLLAMARNAAAILAVELLAAAQGVEFRRPLTTSPKLAAALAAIRARAAFLERDRSTAPDIEAVRGLVEAGHFAATMPAGLLPGTRI
jgi:histidine ammonia-lyase